MELKRDEKKLINTRLFETALQDNANLYEAVRIGIDLGFPEEIRIEGNNELQLIDSRIMIYGKPIYTLEIQMR